MTLRRKSVAGLKSQSMGKDRAVSGRKGSSCFSGKSTDRIHQSVCWAITTAPHTRESSDPSSCRRRLRPVYQNQYACCHSIQGRCEHFYALCPAAGSAPLPRASQHRQCPREHTINQNQAAAKAVLFRIIGIPRKFEKPHHGTGTCQHRINKPAVLFFSSYLKWQSQTKGNCQKPYEHQCSFSCNLNHDSSLSQLVGFFTGCIKMFQKLCHAFWPEF